MAVTTDYQEVVNEIAEDIMGKLAHDSDGSIIDNLQMGSMDPWQLFLYYGILEKVLGEFRKGKRFKNVFIYAQPEGLVGVSAITPVRTLLQHVAYTRREEVLEGRLCFGEIVYDGENLSYEGEDLKKRTCVIICDMSEPNSPYLNECIKLCQDAKAARVIAIPLMNWNPELVDNYERGSQLKEANAPVSGKVN